MTEETTKHPGGRPRLYESPEAFAQKTGEYFQQVEERGKMPTMAGLCLHMGFYDRESFSHYAEYGEEFSRTVKGARLMIEDDRHQRLANPACTGVIFDLKVNHGWQDKTVNELTGADGGPIQSAVSFDPSKLSTGALQELLAATGGKEGA